MQQRGSLKESLSRFFGNGPAIWSSNTRRAGLLLILISMTCHGCILILPGHESDAGRGGLAKAEIPRLQVGETTREEVLLHFGEPSASLNDDKVFTYDWSVVRFEWLIFSPGGAYSPGGFDSGTIFKYYEVVFEFDEQGSLKRYERMTPDLFENGRSIRAVGEPFSADYLQIPGGKSAIFVYRPKDYLVAFVPISVDTNHLTDLQIGGFSVAIVSPGRHEISYPPDIGHYFVESSWEGTPRWKTIHLKLDSGRKLFLRVTPKLRLSGVPVDVSIVSENEALPEISRTKRSSSAGVVP